MDFHSTTGFPDTAIRLVSGVIFDYADPMSCEQITEHDVAHSLARTTRFAGQTGQTYTVAQHALFVYALVTRHFGEEDAGLGALHHDDVESVTGDWPSPLKRFAKLNGFDYKRLLERPIETAICQHLGLQVDELHAGVIKDADRLAFVTEATVLKPAFDKADQGFDDIDDSTIEEAMRYIPLQIESESQIEHILMNLHYKLVGKPQPTGLIQDENGIYRPAWSTTEEPQLPDHPDDEDVDQA
jgi:5'-deoxynucleotidase YfbR-like HD superfamily hydrolase